MNPLTIDHPLTRQTSCFDRKAHPWLSYFSQGLVLALALVPVAAAVILYLIATDDYYGPPEAPPGLFEFAMIILFYCLLIAFLCVAGYRLLGWYFRNLQAKL
jgi:hypothetical protein